LRSSVPKKSRFTSKELALLQAFKREHVSFLLVGLSAAALQGAPVVTQDIDVWIKDLGSAKFQKAVKSVGGFYVPSFGLHPPMIGGEGLELIDLITTMHGLKNFDDEYQQCRKIKISDTLTLPVLSLARILKSKKAVGRPKDKAVIPILQDVLQVIRAKKNENLF